MQFQTQIRKLNEMGFKSFDSVDYFFYFAKNEGKSVRELSKGDTSEYQKSLRYFKLLSEGTKKEPGLELFTTEPVTRTRVKPGRYPHVQAIKLTPKGKKLLKMLKPPVKRSMTRVKKEEAPKAAEPKTTPAKKTTAKKATPKKAPAKKSANNGSSDEQKKAA